MRGDVFDGRGFLKSAISGKEADAKSKTKNIDFDVDLKLGAVAGFNGEALRSVDCKMSRRNGIDQKLRADRQARPRHAADGRFARPCAGAGARSDLSRDQRRRRVLPLHRHLLQDDRRPASLAMEPPTVEPSAKEGLINVRDFTVKGEGSLERVAAGGSAGVQNGIAFSRTARGIHAAERPAHDPRGRREGPDHRRDHRGQHRLSPATRCA